MILLLDYVRGLTNALDSVGRHSASQSYSTLHNSLRVFSGSSHPRFRDLTSVWVKRYECWLLCQGCCRNTVSLYMRLFRSVCRQADKAGLMNYSDSLFEHVFMGYDPCEKRAVSASVISSLMALELQAGSGLAFARDLFSLSFYLRGIPFIDLAHLRRSDVRDGVLYYRRSKTNQSLSVTLEPWALDILARYGNILPDSVYLLPIIKRPLADDEHKQYDSALRLYNKRLHKLSSLLGLEKNLTSYVARHSWATLAYHEGIPVSEISAGLSHTSEQITYAYLESFTVDALADVNMQVVALVNREALTRLYSGGCAFLKSGRKMFRFSEGTGTFTLQSNKIK